MLQMYKVFINDKAVLMLSRDDLKWQLFSKLEIVNFKDASPENLFSITAESHVYGVRIAVAGNIDEAFKIWASQFQWIEAAGGLVINESGAFLGIFRLGKWDLPKGKAESDESIEETALREVEEECGITGLKIQKKLCETYHCYPYKNGFALKVSFWYLMNWSGAGDLLAQADEGIEEVRWFGKNALNEFKSNTYASIAEVLENYF
jgi:8-oxo-dGTP pyrophosphatase MutT (NUDIX family)